MEATAWMPPLWLRTRYLRDIGKRLARSLLFAPDVRPATLQAGFAISRRCRDATATSPGHTG
jgi:hypothetical protein